MLNIKIIETEETKTLSIIDVETGCDFIQDLMGNANALKNYNGDTDNYELSVEDYNWWNEYITNYQADEEQAKELGIEWDDYADEFNIDMEDEHIVKQGIIQQVLQNTHTI